MVVVIRGGCNSWLVVTHGRCGYLVDGVTYGKCNSQWVYLVDGVTRVGCDVIIVL